MTDPRARIPNAELAFLEDKVAYAVAIIQRLKALIYWIDDPEQLQILAGIMADAQALRRSNIKYKEVRKEETQKNRSTAATRDLLGENRARLPDDSVLPQNKEKTNA